MAQAWLWSAEVEDETKQLDDAYFNRMFYKMLQVFHVNNIKVDLDILFRCCIFKKRFECSMNHEIHVAAVFFLIINGWLTTIFQYVDVANVPNKYYNSIFLMFHLIRLSDNVAAGIFTHLIASDASARIGRPGASCPEHEIHVAADFFAHHQRMANNNFPTCFDVASVDFQCCKCSKQILQQYILNVSFNPIMLHATLDNVAAEIFTHLIASNANARIGRPGASGPQQNLVSSVAFSTG